MNEKSTKVEVVLSEFNTDEEDKISVRLIQTIAICRLP